MGTGMVPISGAVIQENISFPGKFSAAYAVLHTTVRSAAKGERYPVL